MFQSLPSQDKIKEAMKRQRKIGIIAAQPSLPPSAALGPIAREAISRKRRRGAADAAADARDGELRRRLTPPDLSSVPARALSDALQAAPRSGGEQGEAWWARVGVRGLCAADDENAPAAWAVAWEWVMRYHEQDSDRGRQRWAAAAAV